jgi:hypothetical protein
MVVLDKKQAERGRMAEGIKLPEKTCEVHYVVFDPSVWK